MPPMQLDNYSFSLHRYLSISYSSNFQKSSEWQLRYNLGCYSSSFIQFNSLRNSGASMRNLLYQSSRVRGMLSWPLTLLSISESDPGIRGLSVTAWCETLSCLSLSRYRSCVTRAELPNLVHELLYWTRQIWLQSTGLELSLRAWRRWQEFVKHERVQVSLGQSRFGGQGSGAYGCGNDDRQGVERSREWGEHKNDERAEEMLGRQKFSSN